MAACLVAPPPPPSASLCQPGLLLTNKAAREGGPWQGGEERRGGAERSAVGGGGFAAFARAAQQQPKGEEAQNLGAVKSGAAAAAAQQGMWQTLAAGCILFPGLLALSFRSLSWLAPAWSIKDRIVLGTRYPLRSEAESGRGRVGRKLQEGAAPAAGATGEDSGKGIPARFA